MRRLLIVSLVLSLSAFFLTFYLYFRFASIEATSPVILVSDYGRGRLTDDFRNRLYQYSPNIHFVYVDYALTANNVWEGSYILATTAAKWQKGSVFVGAVGSHMAKGGLLFVAKSIHGQYFVAANNGMLTFLDDLIGLESLRVLGEKDYQALGVSSNFQAANISVGIDIFSVVAAKIATGDLKFEDIGTEVNSKELFYKIPYDAVEVQDKFFSGSVVYVDDYGSIGTNLSKDLYKDLVLLEGVAYYYKLLRGNSMISFGEIYYRESFIPSYKTGVYTFWFNRDGFLSMGITDKNFSKQYGLEFLDDTFRLEILLKEYDL